LGLPAYSAVRCDLEADGLPGEAVEALAERLSVALWDRLRSETGAVIAAASDVHGFVAGKVPVEA
jgi:hypothetical protein